MGTRAAHQAEHRRGVVLLIAVVMAWGLTWPINKVILENLPPLWAVALRTAIGALTLFGVSMLGGRLVAPRRADLPVLLSITLLHMVGFGVLSTIGLQFVPTGRSVVLAYTTPLWVAPGASLFLKEPLTPRRAAGVVVGLLGLTVLFNPLGFDWADRTVVLGNLAILGAAFLWAASILHIRGHRWQSTPFELIPWATLLAAIILSPIAGLTSGLPTVNWSVPLVGMVLYAGVPGTALAYWAIATASRNLPAVTTSLGLLATPVISIAVATVWLGESPSVTLVVATVLILGGVAIGTTGGRGASIPPALSA